MRKRSQAYFLHFTDVEWKSYDYDFIIELNLPYLLLNSMKGKFTQTSLLRLSTSFVRLYYVFITSLVRLLSL